MNYGLFTKDGSGVFEFACATRTTAHAEKLAKLLPKVIRAKDYVIFSDVDRNYLRKCYLDDLQSIYKAIYRESFTTVPTDSNTLIERILSKLSSLTPETVLEDKQAEDTVETETTTAEEPATEAVVKKTKAKAKKAKAKQTRTVNKKDWETPFRPGTAKEKAFKIFRDFAKKYEELDRGKKGEWIEKTAERLEVAKATLSSWIGGQFKDALK